MANIKKILKRNVVNEGGDRSAGDTSAKLKDSLRRVNLKGNNKLGNTNKLSGSRVSTKKIGDLGENIAIVFLEKHGFEILERNYRTKMGELDVIAQKDNLYYVIEVKTARVNLKGENIDVDNLFNQRISIIRDGTGEAGWFRPEINLTQNKINKIKHLALSYCNRFGLNEGNLRFIGVCVTLYCDGSRVTKDSVLSCRVKTLPLFN
jgi:hypothetical protein